MKHFSKKVLLMAMVLVLVIPFAQAQTRGFNYQAIVQDANGQSIINKEVSVKIVLQDANGTELYSEIHKKMTSANGVLSLVIGNGVSTSGKTLKDVQWNNKDVYVQMHLDADGGSNYKKVGAPTMLQSVPYALYAEQSGAGLIQSKPDANDDEPIFEVRNKKGEVVFAVYQNGATVFVDKDSKALRGGFAVATRGFGKGEEPKDVFSVKGKDVKVIVDDEKAGDKSLRGGFAIATRGHYSKGEAEGDVLDINASQTRFYVSDKDNSKALRGGFAIATRGTRFSKSEGKNDDLMYMDGQETVFNLVDDSKGFQIKTSKDNITNPKTVFSVESSGQVNSSESQQIDKIETASNGSTYKVIPFYMTGSEIGVVNANLSLNTTDIQLTGNTGTAQTFSFNNKKDGNTYYQYKTAQKYCKEYYGSEFEVLTKEQFIGVLERFDIVNLQNPINLEKIAQLITLKGDTWGEDMKLEIEKNQYPVNTRKLSMKAYTHKYLKKEGNEVAFDGNNTNINNLLGLSANEKELASWWYSDSDAINSNFIGGLVALVRDNSNGNFRFVFVSISEIFNKIGVEDRDKLLLPVRCSKKMW